MLKQPGVHGCRHLAVVLVFQVLAGCGGSPAPTIYTNDEGNYRILAVGSTKSSQQKLASQAGELIVFATESIDGNRTSRSVTYTDYPAALVQSRRPEAMLEGLERAMTPGGQWSIENQKSILLDGHPGRELQFSASVPNSSEKGAGRARIYLVGNRLYQVIIVGPASRVTAAELGDYVDSFELLRKVAVAAQGTPPAPDLAGSPQVVQAQPADAPASPLASRPPEPTPALPGPEPEPEFAVAKPEPPQPAQVEVPASSRPAPGEGIAEDNLAERDDLRRPARAGAGRTTQEPAPKRSNPDEVYRSIEKQYPRVQGAGPGPTQGARIAGGPNAGLMLSCRPEPNGNERERFLDVPKEGGVLVGVAVGYINAFGGPKVGMIQPIFRAKSATVNGRRHGRNIPTSVRVIARPGYAVGAIHTRTGLLLDAFQLVFMKLKDGQLDAENSYTSNWLGDPRGGGDGGASGDGNLVVGIHGRSNGREVNMLGLVVAE